MASPKKQPPSTPEGTPTGVLQDGRRRVVIENVTPEIDAGRFPIKRIVRDTVSVEADIFADGHDALSCILQFRKDSAVQWTEAFMDPLGNDRWRMEFRVDETGRYRYAIVAWVDPFKTWRRDLITRIKAGLDISVDLLVGARILKEASRRASAQDAPTLLAWVDTLTAPASAEETSRAANDPDLTLLMQRYSSRDHATTYDKNLAVVVDREKARYSTWYEVFPRSRWANDAHPGTLRDCETRLSYIAALGFDVLYLPPIHPIGRSHRKGKNNAIQAAPDDPGSPWAIGAVEGGHKSVDPQLGTLEDFRNLVRKCADCGLEIALDLAFQCSRDHPYIKEHPEFFRLRPDGTVQYAENPPKKYEDIYPFDFESEHWPQLWEELLGIVNFWISQGVRIFRVDNPHTKPVSFWEWLITKVKADNPDVLFLSEAFTRPKVMYGLAKLGFTQSYTYFTWRNTKSELREYLTELTKTVVSEFFRPNLWPNTPDILPEYLQSGGRPAFMIRLALAATLGASYGIYGPAYELCENRPREAGGEEYLNSEKYEVKQWDIDRADSLKDFIGRVNRIRRDNPALQRNTRLTFHDVDNNQLMCYSKSSDDLTNVIVIAVTLDPFHTQTGWTTLQLDALGVSPDEPFQVEDLLTGTRYFWKGARTFLEINPGTLPAQIFSVRRRTRTERQFDYYV
ncbi:MAG TPA: alpha-1,4-glucan--maltose-1-phosphate maltosyltransferase [Nitrospirales bacterium]